MNKIAIFFIELYQRLLSNIVNANCKYLPTCSEYAKECFHKYNFFKATIKTIWRVIRCNPFSSGGIDLPLLFLALTLNYNLSANTSVTAPSNQKTVSYISSNKANLRTGPGKRYGIQVKLSAKYYPVIVLYTLNEWSKVITATGDQGWIKNNFLKKYKKIFLVVKRTTKLLSDYNDLNSAIASIGSQQLVTLVKKKENWLLIELIFNGEKLKGWIAKDDLWGDV